MSNLPGISIRELSAKLWGLYNSCCKKRIDQDDLALEIIGLLEAYVNDEDVTNALNAFRCTEL